MLWVTTDTHFNHKKLVTGGYRPEGYEELIFADWGNKVLPGDMVIHLGDVVFGKPGETHERIAKLPGYKILVRGNHDKQKREWYLSHGWDAVHTFFAATYCHEEKIRCLFTHEPLSESVWSFLGPGDLIFHGHLHDGGHRRDEPEVQVAKSARHRLVCLETMGYGVFALSETKSHPLCPLRRYRTFKRLTFGAGCERLVL